MDGHWHVNKICLLLLFILCISTTISLALWHSCSAILKSRYSIIWWSSRSTSSSLLFRSSTDTQLSWDTLNKDSAAGGSRGNTVPNEDWLKSLDILEGKIEPVEMTTEEIQAKYKQHSTKSFSLMAVLPEIMQNNYIMLVNRTAESSEDEIMSDDSSIVYVTELELERKWRDSSLLPMGKPTSQFDAKSALLLLDDIDDEEIIGYKTLSGTDGVYDDMYTDGDASHALQMYGEADINADLALHHDLLRRAEEKAANEALEIDNGVEYVITEDVRTSIV